MILYWFCYKPFLSYLISNFFLRVSLNEFYFRNVNTYIELKIMKFYETFRKKEFFDYK
ncbi:hypothetical protein KsCSTR_35040 [Candidatus Kuenenia stuttgartiensis]|uniref:Uncharacterized protein n=1 Tax=Kuenenia stuttgartiensis TaxID=174633 RepID=Q1Q6V6_KUEST|nr:hypothetical protein KsCSTR_35040 [Candidatus Kuenenia stuttgartiensis]CAJ73307.1 unknown protein [Candidatus Kuenenia stuttgartiensis]